MDVITTTSHHVGLFDPLAAAVIANLAPKAEPRTPKQIAAREKLQQYLEGNKPFGEYFFTENADDYFDLSRQDRNAIDDLHQEQHREQPPQNNNAPPDALALRIIDLSKPYPEIEFLLTHHGVGCYSRGDIQAKKSKAKQGKTLSLLCIMVAMIKGEFMGFRAVQSGLRVLYIDTEMNPLNTAKLAKKVHRLCGLPTDQNSDRFCALNLRGDDPLERCRFVCEAVERLKPDAVFIDGVKDLIETDINDQKESGKVVQMLMTLTKTYPIALIVVLHTNKALTDSNMRGSIGTELTNKASEVWEVKKDGHIFEVTQDISRNQPVDGFSFILNDYGEPTEIDFVPKLSRQQVADAKLQENMKASLPPTSSLSYTQLTEIYREMAGVAQKTAQTHIAQASKKCYIERGSDGSYRWKNKSDF